SNIMSIKDLGDKSISAGKRGSGTELAFSRLLGMYGLSYDSIRNNGGTVHFVGYGETKQLFKDRHIQMGIFDHRPPDPAIVEAETAFPVRVLDLGQKMVEDYLKKYPGHLMATIPKGTYKGQEEDVTTLAWAPMMTVNKDLPDELVYNITKAIYENPERLAKGFKTLGVLSPEMAVEGIPIPFHPGAAKYFKEKGVLK
ncbi:MAG: TAXI family TRAP transporter solute-binding subunit, partial [Kiloniellales bacterium]|nr:TAXI family TRAP transporter solute-binding subunit [Kiloniellales bacterium]